MSIRSLVLMSIMVSVLAAPLAAQQAAPAPQAEQKPAQPAETAAPPSPYPTLIEKISYVIGWTMGMNFRKDKIDINLDVMLAGLRDAIAEKPSAIPEQEARESMAALQKQLQDRANAEQQAVAAKNRAEGAAFLEANKIKEGVKVLPSGLQYRIVTEGTGPVPAADDSVMTHYRGTLLSGSEFDSSHKRGEPAKFPVSGLIPGVSEALQLMKVGSKWEIWIPADLAYGDQQAGPDIAPGSVLVFELELLSIEPKAETPVTQGEPAPEAKLEGGKTVEFKDASGKVQSVQVKELSKEEVEAMMNAEKEKAAAKEKPATDQPPKDQPPKDQPPK